MNKIRSYSDTLSRQAANRRSVEGLYSHINRAIDLSTELPLRIPLGPEGRYRCKWQDFQALRELAHTWLPYELKDTGFSWSLHDEQYGKDGKYQTANASESPECTYQLILRLDGPPPPPAPSSQIPQI